MSCASECVGRCIGGAIDVQNRDVLEELVNDAENNIIKTVLPASGGIVKRGSGRQRCNSASNSRQSSRGCRPYAHISTLPENDPDFDLNKPWLNSKSILNLQLTSDPDCRSMKESYDELLNTEELYRQDFEFMKMDQMILNRRRQEMLYKRWTENVFEPIRCEIDKEVNGYELEQLQAQKRRLFKEYIEYINRKGFVFLDVFDPAEYFAFSLNPSKYAGLVAVTDKLNDPLLFQAREKNREDAVAFRCSTGYDLRDRDMEMVRLPPLPLVPLGRHCTTLNTWNNMQLKNIDSPARLASRRKMRPNRNHSNVNFFDVNPPDSQDSNDYVCLDNNKRLQTPVKHKTSSDSQPIHSQNLPTPPPTRSTMIIY